MEDVVAVFSSRVQVLVFRRRAGKDHGKDAARCDIKLHKARNSMQMKY